MVLVLHGAAQFPIGIVSVPRAGAHILEVIAPNADFPFREIRGGESVALAIEEMLLQTKLAVSEIGLVNAVHLVVLILNLLQEHARLLGINLPRARALAQNILFHRNQLAVVGVIVPDAVLLLIDKHTFRGFAAVLVVDNSVHLVDALDKVGGTLQFAIGMVITKSAIGHIVLELALIHQFALLILFPYALLPARSIGLVDVGRILSIEREGEQATHEEHYSFHILILYHSFFSKRGHYGWEDRASGAIARPVYRIHTASYHQYCRSHCTATNRCPGKWYNGPLGNLFHNP